jgi:hypothetical protein
LSIIVWMNTHCTNAVYVRFWSGNCEVKR